MMIAAGLLLVYPAPLTDWIGIGLMVAVAISQKLRPHAPAMASP